MDLEIYQTKFTEEEYENVFKPMIVLAYELRSRAFSKEEQIEMDKVDSLERWRSYANGHKADFSEAWEQIGLNPLGPSRCTKENYGKLMDIMYDKSVKRYSKGVKMTEEDKEKMYTLLNQISKTEGFNKYGVGNDLEIFKFAERRYLQEKEQESKE